LRRRGDELRRRGDMLRDRGDTLRDRGDRLQRRGDELRRRGDTLRERGDTLGRATFLFGRRPVELADEGSGRPAASGALHRADGDEESCERSGFDRGGSLRGPPVGRSKGAARWWSRLESAAELDGAGAEAELGAGAGSGVDVVVARGRDPEGDADGGEDDADDGAREGGRAEDVLLVLEDVAALALVAQGGAGRVVERLAGAGEGVELLLDLHDAQVVGRDLGLVPHEDR